MCINVLKYTHKERVSILKHITNYKPSDFAKLLNVSVKTLQPLG